MVLGDFVDNYIGFKECWRRLKYLIQIQILLIILVFYFIMHDIAEIQSINQSILYRYVFTTVVLL